MSAETAHPTEAPIGGEALRYAEVPENVNPRRTLDLGPGHPLYGLVVPRPAFPEGLDRATDHEIPAEEDLRRLGHFALNAVQHPLYFATDTVALGVAAASELADTVIHQTNVDLDRLLFKRNLYSGTLNHMRQRPAAAVKEWWAKEWTFEEKVKGPIKRAAGMINLVTGDFFATLVQGEGQRIFHPNTAVSFLIGIAANVFVDGGFTYMAASENDKLRAAGKIPETTPQDIVQASASAVVFGGAQAAQENGIGVRHMFFPVAAFVGLFSSIPAAGGAFGERAAAFVEYAKTPFFVGAVAVLAAAKKAGEYTKYDDGALDWASGKLVKGALATMESAKRLGVAVTEGSKNAVAKAGEAIRFTTSAGKHTKSSGLAQPDHYSDPTKSLEELV